MAPPGPTPTRGPTELTGIGDPTRGRSIPRQRLRWTWSCRSAQKKKKKLARRARRRLPCRCNRDSDPSRDSKNAHRRSTQDATSVPRCLSHRRFAGDAPGEVRAASSKTRPSPWTQAVILSSDPQPLMPHTQAHPTSQERLREAFMADENSALEACFTWSPSSARGLPSTHPARVNARPSSH